MSAALAKLHIARKELGLDEPTYRAMLLRLTGQESAKGLSDDQIGRVLDEMKAKGWAPKVAARGRPTARAKAADHPVARKARAMWISLWELGEVADPSEAALEAFAKRQLRCERLQWSDQGLSYKLIEALKAWGQRAGWSQPAKVSVFDLKLGLFEAQCVVLYRAGARGVLDLPSLRDAAEWTEIRLDAEIMKLGAAIRKAKAG